MSLPSKHAIICALSATLMAVGAYAQILPPAGGGSSGGSGGSGSSGGGGGLGGGGGGGGGGPTLGGSCDNTVFCSCDKSTGNLTFDLKFTSSSTGTIINAKANTAPDPREAMFSAKLPLIFTETCNPAATQSDCSGSLEDAQGIGQSDSYMGNSFFIDSVHCSADTDSSCSSLSCP
jgi:hypothetical protein